MNIVLTVILALLVLGYAAYLAVKLWKGRGKSCCSCSGCPYAGKCGSSGGCASGTVGKRS